MLCSHNTEVSIDLPLHTQFLDARRHDSVSAIVSLREFKSINPDIPVKGICLDSVYDNYSTYGFCKEWGIRPFINLNKNRGRPDSIPDSISIDTDGTPMCMVESRMVNCGYCRQKHSVNGAVPLPVAKWIPAPAGSNVPHLAMGAASIPSLTGISGSIPPLPRDTDEYKKIYNNRTFCERVNNRILNDYHLHDMGIHTRKRYSFFTMIRMPG